MVFNNVTTRKHIEHYNIFYLPTLLVALHRLLVLLAQAETSNFEAKVVRRD